MKNYRKGFTLIEFIIVAAVVGVLSEMMLFTNLEAAYSSKASDIIINLKNIKFLARAYYSESMDVYSPELEPDLPNKITKHLSKYLGGNAEDLDNYYIKVDNNKNFWWVCYKNVDDNIRGKLINKAKSAGLKDTNLSDFGTSESNIVTLQIN